MLYNNIVIHCFLNYILLYYSVLRFHCNRPTDCGIFYNTYDIRDTGRNAKRNAERNAERNAKRNAESNAERNVVRNAESNA